MTTHLPAAGRTRRYSAAPVRLVGLLAGLVRLAGGLAALLIACHTALVYFGADQSNPVSRFFAEASAPLTRWFDGLFTPADPQLVPVVNNLIALVFWLVVAGVIAALLRATLR